MLASLSSRLLTLSSLSARAVPRTIARSLVASATYEEIASFREVKWPEEWPFADERFFLRGDETPDSVFYDTPRFVTHIDDGAIESISKYYGSVMTDDCDVLDLCSSWISHLPTDIKYGRVAGLGMNEEELRRNSQLTEYHVQDLNASPKLPFDDGSFDFVCNVVSVDCEAMELKPHVSPPASL